MKTEVKTITPDMAKIMLELNTENRKLRPTWVDHLIGLLARGEWELTHQGIAISWDNVILDGQHRLHAIAKSGIPAQILLSTNCDPKLFKCIDRGIPRNNTDLTKLPRRTVEVLNFLGIVHTNDRKKLSPDEILALNERFGKYCEQIMANAPTCIAMFSTASIRAAVVVLMEDGYGEKALDLYRRLTHRDFDGLPNITKVFVRQILSGSLSSAGSRGQMILFCKALKAFDSREFDAGTLPYTDAVRDKCKGRVAKLSIQLQLEQEKA